MQIKALALAGLLLATPAFAQNTTVPPERWRARPSAR